MVCFFKVDLETSMPFDRAIIDVLGNAYVERNGTNANRRDGLDFRAYQQPPTVSEGIQGQFFVSFINCANLRHKDWDHANDAQVLSVQVLDSPVDDQRRYRLESLRKSSDSDFYQPRSLWEARVCLHVSGGSAIVLNQRWPSPLF